MKSKLIGRCAAALLLTVALAAPLALSRRTHAMVVPTATRVYGQLGAFDMAYDNNSRTTPTGLDSRESVHLGAGIGVEPGGGLYIADRDNRRVVYFPSGSTTATRVYGQQGDLTSDTLEPVRSAGSLWVATSVKAAPDGGVYISDEADSRVLYYPPGSTTATRVYGQLGSFTTAPATVGPPPAPTNLTASAVSQTRISLSWIDRSTTETGFTIERSTNGSSYTEIGTAGANATTYADTTVSKNRTYYYRVRAHNALGSSAYSNVATATTPR